MKQFPVMVGVGGGFSVPWSLVEPFERQARANHGQSLERLAERGGLSPIELWAVMHGRGWDVAREQITDEAARAWALSLVSVEAERDELRAQVERVRKAALNTLALGDDMRPQDVLDALEGKS